MNITKGVASGGMGVFFKILPITAMIVLESIKHICICHLSGYSKNMIFYEGCLELRHATCSPETENHSCGHDFRGSMCYTNEQTSHSTGQVIIKAALIPEAEMPMIPLK